MINFNNILNARNPNIKIRCGPDGIHFFNRKTGINILVDEIPVPERFWAKAPRQVSIALTNACDLNCPHCYASKKSAALDFNLLIHWLTELDTNGCVGIGLGGGEPTLYPKLAELCSYAAKNTKLSIVMTTHGHRLTDRLLGMLNGNINFIRVSMDGIGSTYESIRHRSFDSLIDRISALSQTTYFGINYLVNANTIEDLEKAIDISTKLGASEFLLIPEVGIGRGKSIDNGTNAKLKKWVSRYNGSIALSVSEGGSEGLPVCNPFNISSGLDAFAHIDAFGLLKQTSYDSDGISIKKEGVIEALYNLKAIKMEVE